MDGLPDPSHTDPATAPFNGLEAFCNQLSMKLCQYFDDQIEYAKKSGITFVPGRRERATTPEQRMEWLVRRVVQRWTKMQIVEEYGLGNPNKPENAAREVGRETNKLARIIGMQIPLL